ncbi:uncharacterized protein LOC119165416 isoform X1 [Rhipicephalus microplus]|uniref:uncharacterized protein LOC119165416 isoform X1 n=2 Tax=Rhipicephalus microplus TaxID=6941 RepID=UPI003F6AE424
MQRQMEPCPCRFRNTSMFFNFQPGSDKVMIKRRPMSRGGGGSSLRVLNAPPPSKKSSHEGEGGEDAFAKLKTASTEMLQDIHETSSKGCQTSLPMTRMQETQTPSNLRTRDCGTTTHPMFFCKDCGGTFVTALRLHWHSRTSHPNKLLPCTCFDCSRSPSNRNQVKMHERPFTCYICQKGFFRADDVEKHMRVHTKEKRSYDCKECGRRFNVSNNLSRHRKVHTEDAGTHACAECGKTFKQKTHLKSHMRTHTGERPYQCSLCSQRFTELGSARKHERIVHARDYPHYCPHCGKGLANKNKLKKHIRGRHFEFEMVDSDEEGESVMQTGKTK